MMTDNNKTFLETTCPYPVSENDTVQALMIMSESETNALAAQISSFVKAGDVIALWGNLGAGKSAFCRGLIRSLTSPDEDVPSPTFTLVQVYEPEGGDPVWHFDLYRIEHPDEIYELGFEDALETALSLLEWPSRMGNYLPRQRLDLVIDFVTSAEECRRQIYVVARGPAWGKRLKEMGL